MKTPQAKQFTREILFNRHRLSHQQIDEWLDEKESKNYLPEKLEQMALVAEFFRVTDAIKSADINFISLKGPVLSYRLYKDASYRWSWDLDFLLDAECMEQALQALSQIGYVALFHNWPANKNSKQLFLWHRHHFNIWHPEKDVTIELHWKLSYFHFVKPAVLESLTKSNVIQLKFAGRDFAVFNIEFELLFLIIHGGLHDWKRLKWLVDVNQLLQQYSIDEEKFLNLTDTMKAGRMVALCNALLHEYFPYSSLLPQKQQAPAFLIQFAHAQINEEKGVEYDSIAGFAKFYFAKLIAFPGIKYKFIVLKQLFFMPEDMDNERMPSNQFFFYMAGPFNKLKRRIKLSRKEKSLQ